MALDHHRAAGGVVEAHGEAGRRLFGVGFERAGLVGNQRDLDRSFGGMHVSRRQYDEHGADGQQHAVTQAARPHVFQIARGWPSLLVHS